MFMLFCQVIPGFFPGSSHRATGPQMPRIRQRPHGPPVGARSMHHTQACHEIAFRGAATNVPAENGQRLCRGKWDHSRFVKDIVI